MKFVKPKVQKRQKEDENLLDLFGIDENRIMEFGKKIARDQANIIFDTATDMAYCFSRHAASPEEFAALCILAGMTVEQFRKEPTLVQALWATANARPFNGDVFENKFVSYYPLSNDDFQAVQTDVKDKHTGSLKNTLIRDIYAKALEDCNNYWDVLTRSLYFGMIMCKQSS